MAGGVVPNDAKMLPPPVSAAGSEGGGLAGGGAPNDAKMSCAGAETGDFEANTGEAKAAKMLPLPVSPTPSSGLLAGGAAFGESDILNVYR